MLQIGHFSRRVDAPLAGAVAAASSQACICRAELRVGALARRAAFAVFVVAPALAALPLPASLAGAQELGGAAIASGITSVPGIRAGHFTYPGGRTGCTVVVADGGAVAGVDVRGGAPGTVETDLLDPVNTVQEVNAVALAGGSAFGLAARQGVVRWLEEQGQGYSAGPGLVVPIVPGAVIFDLRVSEGTRPGADCGYEAADAAGAAPLEEGNAGAGAGATVGKLLGPGQAMRGGVGTAAVALDDGLVVAALVVVNAVGDVIDPAADRILAGARSPDGGLADARLVLRQGAAEAPPGQNTTVGVVATNALLTQAQATKVAQMAHDGIARTIVPSHTPADGDAIFALATGRSAGPADVGRVGALAAEAVAEAVLRAVRAAAGIPGIPAAGDLPGR